MKTDFLTFKRATSVSLIGLGIQGGLALLCVLFGRYSHDHAGVTASIYIGIGVLIWLALALLFDQHRRERIEAMEAESLEASSSAAASAFEMAGDDVRAAARRLANIQRFVLPAASIVVGALLIVFGWFRFQSARALLVDVSEQGFSSPDHGGWGVGVGLTIAFVGFVFARFVSGMGKEREWSALRAGGAAAVGAALVGLLIAIAHFVELAAGVDWPIRYLPVVIPIAMMIFGFEVLGNFLLDLYRPRQPGQVYRPAFDSRVLGFLAAPDKIAESVGEALSYQFGVDVTGSWFYRLLSRSFIFLILFALLIGWLLTSLVVVQPHQRGLVLNFGEIDRPLWSFGQSRMVERPLADGQGIETYEEIGPGLHIKWPWPISTVDIPRYEGDDAPGEQRTATGVRVLSLGSAPPDEDKAVLWGEDHNSREILQLVQPSADSGSSSSSTRDFSLLAVEVPVHYVVSDVQLYDSFAAPGQRDDLLEAIGRRVVTRTLASLTESEVLATRRSELPSLLRDAIEGEFALLNSGLGPGIRILYVGAHGVHPPKDAAQSFERVVQARQNAEALIEDAQKYEINELTGIAGSVDLAREIVDQLAALTRDAGTMSEEQRTELELDVQRLLEGAGGEAGEKLLSAGASRWRRHMDERGRAALFVGQSASYEAAPDLYRTREYLATLRTVMDDARVFITPQDMRDLKILLELQDRETTRNVFDTQAGAENQ